MENGKRSGWEGGIGKRRREGGRVGKGGGREGRRGVPVDLPIAQPLGVRYGRRHGGTPAASRAGGGAERAAGNGHTAQGAHVTRKGEGWAAKRCAGKREGHHRTLRATTICGENWGYITEGGYRTMQQKNRKGRRKGQKKRNSGTENVDGSDYSAASRGLRQPIAQRRHRKYVYPRFPRRRTHSSR